MGEVVLFLLVVLVTVVMEEVYVEAVAFGIAG